MTDHTVIIIGAGFSGLYQLYSLREKGIDAHVIEAGADVGGTWFLNRYPGARCDIESIEYSYSFDPDLEQSWDWSERYAAQPEILAYVQHVADRHNLRRDITFNTRVEQLNWRDTDNCWSVTTDTGQSLTARYVIAATGCLSKPTNPHFEGMDDFCGDMYRTSSWPHEGVDLSGKKVAVIGTGSSGLQTITTIAPQVDELTVFQRTPSFAAPAHNGPIHNQDESKQNYSTLREHSKMTFYGFRCPDHDSDLLELDPSQVDDALREAWAYGGLCFGISHLDIIMDTKANKKAADFVREHIRDTVTDPATADKLSPTSYPIAAKRMCVDTGYYETYNRDNVHLIDIHEQPIRRFCRNGIIAGDTEHDFDVIILATGFDAMTGALNAMEIRSGDTTLRDKWAHGPRNYLGLMAAGFPNLFTITGPLSPSVLSNMLTSIECHVDWITTLLDHMREQGVNRIEPTQQAEDNWVDTSNDAGDLTLFPQASSWYMGTNIPGKRRTMLPFAGGVGLYKLVVDGVANSYYNGFEMRAG